MTKSIYIKPTGNIKLITKQSIFLRLVKGRDVFSLQFNIAQVVLANTVLLLLLLLLLSRFSRVRLCATPQMAAYQAPRSLGFSRQEHWSGLPFPSPMHLSEK